MSEPAANPSAAPSPNAAQIEDWNGPMGQRWLKAHERLDPQVAPAGFLAMDRAKIAPGERVLDVGCGCGETSLELARRVGPDGAVIGIDVSRPLLEEAKALIARKGLRHVSFLQADAQTQEFTPGSFDVVFSRFGVMFFADPVAAFTNLHHALRPGGRLSFACWRAPQESQFVTIPMAAAMRHLPKPEAGDPHAPGPFAFADAERVRAILTQAGFIKIDIAPMDHKIGGAPAAELAHMLLEMGPASRLVRDADAAIKAAVKADLEAMLAPLQTPAGVFLDTAFWQMSARRP